ncbi:ATP synthase subunit E [Treponema primitia]|uniref:ATP synthase subunit E n=1 Tax=Treponema primitia TaxID=88058 RepID=UPI000255577F|nr:ATP synthase subunit E [Treponema primitia]
MEIQLQELIDKIKKDGIVSASEEAARLKSQADSDAKRIVESAQREAEGIIAKAKTDSERFEKAGTAALEQASRNLVLAFKGEIEALLDKIIAAKTASSYGEDTLKAIIPELVKSWVSKGADSLDLILSEDNLNKLRSYFNDQLVSEINKGVELKSDRNLGAGFRIATKDGSAYYDFSVESVAELLSSYLNPRLAEILKTSAKGN